MQAQIDALPTVDEVASMDLEGQNEVYAQASTIWDAYYELTEGEQEQVDVSALEQLADYFNGLITVATDTFQIGNTIYASWSDAIDAANDGDTITLLRSVTYSSSSVLTVTAGKNVTLDLNGFTLSKTYSETSTSSLITNNGTLTITDSSEAQTGTISVIASNTSTISSATVFLAAIRNAGTLNLNGGTIKTSTKSASSKMKLWCVVNTASGAGVVLDGASVVVEKTSTYYSSYGIYNNADNTSIEVKSGSISVSSPASASTAGIGTNTSCSSSSITMSGGTIDVNCTRDESIATAYYGILAESGSTTVTGGKITVASKGGAYGIKANENSLAEVSGLTMTVSTSVTTSSSLGYYLMSYANITSGNYTMKDVNNLYASMGTGVTATGGTYSDDIDVVLCDEDENGWVAEGYVKISNNDGTYYIGKKATETFTVYYGTVPHIIEIEEDQTYDLTVSDEEGLEYGIPNNFLYGGLYRDSSYTNPYKVGDEDFVDVQNVTPQAGDIYYVRIVSDSYFKAKCLYAWDTTDEIIELWPVLGVDCLDYSEIGFIIDGQEYSIEEDETYVESASVDAKESEAGTVYSSVTITYEGGNPESTTVTCHDTFSVVDGYIGVYQDIDMSDYSGEDSFTLQTYYYTLDGVRVTGAYERTVTFNEDKTDFDVEDTKIGSTVGGDSGTEFTSIYSMLSVRSNCTLMVPTETTTYTITKYEDGIAYTQEVEANADDVEVTYEGKEGSLFAGWYMDENYTTAADFSDITGDMTVYARYVSDDYLQVKITNVTTKGVVTGVRAVSAVDGKNYAEVGFVYEYAGTTATGKTKTYVTTLSGNTAVKLFGGEVVSGSKLVYNDLKVTGMSAGTEIEITPYWVTKDGTIVYGTSRTVTYTGSKVE